MQSMTTGKRSTKPLEGVKDMPLKKGRSKRTIARNNNTLMKEETERKLKEQDGETDEWGD